ncbi:MAG: STAS domain-containing protein, partial [Pirellulales bacterium]|nr:STAS domain-containing protein [Pirellulales bacterium]
MTVHRRLEVAEVGDVTVVRFVDRKILDEASIQELGQELFQLVEGENRTKLVLNFSKVDFLSSAALGKLISLEKKVKVRKGKLSEEAARQALANLSFTTSLEEAAGDADFVIEAILEKLDL